MVDVLTPEQRRLNMSRVKGRNTRPEMLLRRGLHARGFRFRLHSKELPGRPDLVFPKHRACVFVHGCFWHGHTCALSKMPSTRKEFWENKISGNRARDQKVAQALFDSGWKVLIVWECATRGRHRLNEDELINRCAKFITTPDTQLLEIPIMPGQMA